MDFLLGTILGLLIFTLLFYVSAKALSLLLTLLQATLGPLPYEAFQTFLAFIGDHTVYVALLFAAALSVVNLTIRWDDLKPKTRAWLENVRYVRKVTLRD